MTYLEPDMFDVAVVGCGPVGALACNLLAKFGLSVVALEKEHSLHPLPRAVHLDHEMMRLFQDAGVIGRVLPDTRHADGHLHVGADGDMIRYMGTKEKPRPFGWANDYFFYQPELEAHLRAAMVEEREVDFRSGATFTGLDQNEDTVCVSYRSNGENHAVRARWLIACDGARSPVRKALGISLQDLNFEEPWLVVDAEVNGDVRFPDIGGLPESADLQHLSVMLCDPRRPTTLVPGRGNHRRWEFMLLPGENDQEMMQADNVAKLIAPYLADVPHQIVRAATYRFHGLVAENWQRGNVFLAGDAAHQTPPFFGQGMCHGMRDAANLAWKMAAVRRDGADAAILGTYETERNPHVRRVIEAAVSAGRYICELDPSRAAERDLTIRQYAEVRSQETATDLIPAIGDGLVLKGTPAAGERFIQPVLGDGRLLDDETGGGWRLFVQDRGMEVREPGISGIAIADLDDGGAITEWLRARNVDAVLVRPDHYVFGTHSGSVGELVRARNAALGFQELVA